MPLKHTSTIDGKEYYADINVLLAHVINRHVTSDDDNAAKFDVNFLGDAANCWSIVCKILDNGDFNEDSNAAGSVHSRIWYLNFYKHGKNTPTGRGLDKDRRPCEFKGVQLVAHVNSFDGTNEGYLVQTMYPKGTIT